MTLTEFLAARPGEDEGRADAGRWLLAARRIVAEHNRVDDGWMPGDRVVCGACGGYVAGEGPGGRGYQAQWPCPTLRALAAVWSDHPDYDEAWRV